MSGYLSSLLTNTTSRYTNLRRTLLSSEEDGDTPDDSHISRVLRAYYTEKGRPFPPWLPPDPNDRRAHTPQPQVQQYGYASQRGPAESLRMGAQSAQGGRGSLNDLWDSPGAQPAAPAAPQSLRAGRRVPGGARPDPSAGSLAPPRPLPSQRAGSYQSYTSQGGGGVDPSPPGSSSGGGGTAQERLKARLWGSGRNSPGLGGGRVT